MLRFVSFVLTVALPTAALAAVPTYSGFELEARSNIVDGYNLPANSSFNSKTAALNDARTVAFTLIVVGSGDGGLWVGSRGEGSVVYSALPDRLLDNPSINALGDCAFAQSDFVSDGIFVYDASSGTTSQAIAPITFSVATRADITDAGGIGYRASAGGPQSWRFWSGSEAIFAAEAGGIAFLFTPSTNDQGKIAGKVRLGSTSGSSPDEIRVYSGPGTFTTIAVDDDANPASPYVGFDNAVSLAPDGRVAFIADRVAGGRGVFLSDGLTTLTIATTATPGVSTIAFFPPTANGQGLVAFRGTDAQGLDAIFVGDGKGLLRVVGEHDLVPTDLGTARIDQHDDSVVFGGAVALNEHGDLAFNASLTPPGNNQVEWGSGMFVAYAATGAPPPVPDGATVPGSPMTAGLAADGVHLDIAWDVTSCPADEYNLFFGDLAGVGTVTISAAACGLGTSGTATVLPPPGDVFFLLAAESAGGIESGHGVDSDGNPRPSSGVGFCGIGEQSLDGTCP